MKSKFDLRNVCEKFDLVRRISNERKLQYSNYKKENEGMVDKKTKKNITPQERAVFEYSSKTYLIGD